MLLSSIIWDIDPIMFSIGGRDVRWYGFLLATGFLIGYLILGNTMRKEGYKQTIIDKFAITIIIGVVVGLRLGHCLFYGPYFDVIDETGKIIEEGYLNHPLNMLKVWEGGLASHGGAIGILLAIFIFSKRRKISYLELLDKVVLVVPLAGSMVRLGNLMNSEIIGIPTNVSWGFVFSRLGHDYPSHPTQLYEAIFYLTMFFVFYFIYKKYHSGWKHGTFLGWFMIILFGFRYIIEYTKIDPIEFTWNFPLNMGQLLSIPFILVGAFFLWREYAGKTKSNVPME